MHEVVTLQFGNRANYIATHFWNVQESYFTYPTPTDPTPQPSPVDHDINFRPGIGADGSDTYTPRTLIYDFQSSFGGLRKVNALYDDVKPDEVIRGLWDGIQQTQTLPPVEPIPYQINLESGLPTPQLRPSDVRYWSDFNRLFYHPRSVLPLSPQSFSSSLNAAESWSNGTDLFKDLDREVDLLDRDVRLFAEECDSLSAFQVFTSADDSWGGYASSFVESLREEYGKKGIWVWAIEDGRRVERTKQYQRLANSARSLRSMTQNASVYVRLSNIPSLLPEYVRLDTQSEWSTSALVSTAIESATLPTRIRNDGSGQTASLSLFEDMLNTNGNQNVLTLKGQVRNSDSTMRSSANSHAGNQSNAASRATDHRIQHPAPSESQDDREAELDLEPSAFDIDFSPSLPQTQTTFPSLASRRSRGPEDDHIFAQIESHRHQFSSNVTPHDVSTLQRRRYTNDEPIVSIYNTPLAFPLLTSYPATLFHKPTFNSKVLFDAALSTTSSTKRDVFGLRDLVAGRMGRGLALIEAEEVESMYDELTRLGEAYAFGWEGSDDDDYDEEDETGG